MIRGKDLVGVVVVVNGLIVVGLVELELRISS